MRRKSVLKMRLLRNSPEWSMGVFCALVLAVAAINAPLENEELRRASFHPPSAEEKGGIIFLPPLITNFFLVTHAADRLIGTSRPGRSVLRREILSQIYPALRNLPLVTLGQGYLPNLEMMLLNRPAAILASTRITEMRQVGFNVADITWCRNATEHAQLYLDSIGQGRRIGEAAYPSSSAPPRHSRT